MPSLVCQSCESPVPWDAGGCARCGVAFEVIRCVACSLTDTPLRFTTRKCPRCSKDSFTTVPIDGDLVDEVGAEAFIDDVPTGGAGPRSAPKRSPEPAVDRSKPPGPKSKPTTPASRSVTPTPSSPRTDPGESRGPRPAARATPPPPGRQPPPRPAKRETAADEYGVVETDEAAPRRAASNDRAVSPPTKHKADPPTQPPSPDRRAAPAPRHEEPAARRTDADQRPVLKRQRWTPPVEDDTEQTPDAAARREDDDATELDGPAEPPERSRSVRSEPVASATPRRYRLELSPKGQQILRWAALAAPVAIVLIGLVWWMVGSSRSRPSRPNDLAVAAGDRGVLEARATEMYQAAIEYYRAGQTEAAVTNLEQIVGQYSTTTVVGPAQEALDRHSRNEPLFPEFAPARPAEPETKTPEPAPPPAPVEPKKVFIGIPKTAPSAAGNNNTLATGTNPAATPPHPGSNLEKSDVAARPLPPGFEAVSEAGTHSSGWPIEIVCLKDRSHMLLVPPGEFEMGSAAGAANARPPHKVTLKAFYIDQYEITALRYAKFLDEKGLRGSAADPATVAKTDGHPVVGVAWRDANFYAQWAAKSLPTEAQWEKAARGPDGRTHPWGSGAPQWGKPREAKQIDPIGSFAWDVSYYGCFDMAANAAEWCADWYDPNYYAGSPAADPTGPAESLPPVEHTDPERTLRGGSPTWEVAWRAPGGLNDKPLHVGFRCVLNVEEVVALPTAAASNAGTTKAAPAPPAETARPRRLPPGGFRF